MGEEVKKVDFINLIKQYISVNELSKMEFCRLADLSPLILDNMLNDGLYVSFHDYRKVALVIGYDFSDNRFFIFE